MTSILEVATHWPRQVALVDRAPALGLSDIKLRRYSRGFGLRDICWDPDETELMALYAAAGKLASLKGREAQVRYVIRARTVRFSTAYPLAPVDQLTEMLGLDRPQTFAVTDQACASGLLALDLAGMLLEADDDPTALALVLTGEKAISPVSQIIPGVSITGEATAAVLVGQAEHDRLLGYAVRTVPIPGAGLVMSPAAQKQFNSAYPGALSDVMTGALEAAGLSTADIDLVLPHNVNAMVWTRMAAGLGYRADQVFLDNVCKTGHCFTADPFINYESAVNLGRLRPGQHYLMVSVGLGATFAAMVFQR